MPCPPCGPWISVGEFQAQFPEFQNTSTQMIQNWILKATPFFDPLRWDDLLSLGVLYWVAHQIQLGLANAAQPLTDDASSQKAGSVGYTRDSKLLNAESDNPYLRTTYGQQYLYYMRYVGVGGIAL
jgi:hypothetical protein